MNICKDCRFCEILIGCSYHNCHRSPKMVDVWDAHWCGEFQPRGEVEPSPSEDLIWAIQHVGEAAKDELAKVLFYDSLGGYVFEAGDITLSRNLFNFHSIPEFIRWVRERVPSQEC